MKLKLRSIGKSAGIVLPIEMLRRLNVKEGDFLFATETPDGLLLAPCDPEVAEQVRLGREFMSKHARTFRALAEMK